MLKKEIIFLDGVKNGIVCYCKRLRRNLLYRETELFQNFDVLNNILSYKGFTYKDNVFTFSFINKNNKRTFVNINNSIKTENNTYLVFDKEDLYELVPVENYKIKNAGYIVIKNGDSEIISDYNIGVPLLKSLRQAISETIKLMLLYPEYNISLEKSKYNETIIKMNNSSVKIIIMDRKNLYNDNIKRKEEGKNALPFKKNYDRYMSQYIVVIQDVQENNRMAYEAENTIHKIIEIINNLYPELNARFDIIEIKNAIDY